MSGTPLISQGSYTGFGVMLMAPRTAGPHKLPFADWEFVGIDLGYKRPARPCGLEVLQRVEWIDIRDARGGQSEVNGTAVVPSTAPDAIRTKRNHAFAWTTGLNVYLLENVTLMADFVYVKFGDRTRAERPHARWANELLFRAQLDF